MRYNYETWRFIFTLTATMRRPESRSHSLMIPSYAPVATRVISREAVWEV